jgi:hypothetical protein
MRKTIQGELFLKYYRQDLKLYKVMVGKPIIKSASIKNCQKRV